MARFSIGIVPPLPKAPVRPRIAIPLRWSCRGQHPLIRSDSPTSWTEMAKLGDYRGHWAGDFNFTPETFAAFVRNFEAQENAIPVKYGHPMGEDTPAAGWIHEMAIGKLGRPDWICGLVEWTDKAAQHIRDGEFRFTSIVFDTVVPNRVTGEDQGPTIFELGLVGSPFMDGQTPLSLAP